MSLPSVRTYLTSAAPAVNPQDLSAIAHVVGCCSAGTANKPAQLTTVADVQAFGYGPGIEQAAEILATAGGPVYFTKSATTTPGTLGSVSKTPGNPVGVAQFFGGELIIPAANVNGLEVISKAAGVTFTIVVAGNGTALTVPALGAGVKDVVVNSATDGGGAATSTASDIATAIAAQATVAALIGATALGTGAAVCGAQAVYALDKGALTITPKAQGVRVKNQVSGNSTLLDATTAASDLTIVDSTGLTGLPTGTAGQIKTKIEAVAAAAALVSVALVGDGTGLLGRAAAFAALQFGSTGAVILSGVPNDGYQLQLLVARGGALGTATVRWAVDYLAGTSLTPTWSSETLIPGGGVVALKNSGLDTGVTATFSGAFDPADLFTATTTRPTSGSADVLAAVDAAIAETRFNWGFLTGPDVVSKATASLIDGRCQATFAAGSRDIYALFNTRDQAEGVPGEVVADYQAALQADFLGFVAARGFVSMSAGAVLHISPYTLRQYRRPAVFAAASRKASIPIHENLGKVGSGPLRNVLHLFYDESKNPGLHDARFIVALTYPQRPGYFYFAGAPTMADPNSAVDAGYTLIERTCLGLQVSRIAQAVALDYLNDSLPGSAAADPASGAVAGAIDITSAKDIESRCGTAIETFLFAKKSDGKASASPLAPSQKHAHVRRDNNFLSDRRINIDCMFIPLGLAQSIVITTTVKIPG